MGHHGGVAAKSALRRRSATFFLYLHQLPRWVPLVVLPALLIGGLALPGVPGAALLAVLAFLLWFAFMASPVRAAGHHLVRLAVPLILLGVAIVKLVT